MTIPTQTLHTINGLQIAAYEWAGIEPTHVLAHATGFHARLWDQVVAHLDGRRVIALDLRGHGHSSKPTPPKPYAWHAFADDLVALDDALDLRGAVGVGHSCGGHAVALAAALKPDLFSRIILIDPVIFPKAGYTTQISEGEHYTARRRNEWASSDEMFERFKDRSPFDLWDRAVLHDYVDYGLLPNPDGDGFVLACPPAIEAAIYRQSGGSNIYPQLETVMIPALIMRLGVRSSFSPDDMAGSPTNPDLWRHFQHGHDMQLTDYTHFAPMQNPAHIAQLILDFANG